MTTTLVPERSRGRRAWDLTWRLLVAGLVGLGAVVAVWGTAAEADPQFEARTSAMVWFFTVEVLSLFVATPLYVLRGRAPLLMTGVIVVVSSFSQVTLGLAMLAVVSMATRRRWVEILPVGLLWVGGGLIGDRLFDRYVAPPPEVSTTTDLVATMLGPVVLYALLAVTGMFIGGRRALIASLREQAATARREADARGQTARAAERNRIAREMHDVLAHRLSLVALHSGALEYRAGLDPDQVRETAAVVRANAHDALGELREVLGLLRESTPGGEEHSRPQPTFAQVDDLLEGTRAAGTPVTLVLDHVEHDDLTHLPVTTSRHLYRLVQETLTNARKHAPGQPVTVRLHGTPGERLTLTVTNPVPATAPTTPLPSSGWGLTGLAERVRLTGGHLDAHLTPDGTFTVDAWLPWAAAPETPA
ncbi:integral membrane sensor signal transduction histidine kinase [Cellulomonas flavigena DSM 20109]|uniref:histidine kinase n=1 Tax=Cellulomonas flavigena (strain ATCC 482 / DSM 20109 / BCRC 11376 / JCM 18109 / NBRC 3775 / NCIMB 8073 / NRS 134) TaxID=446466 RepID=D5UJY9_CELFN|nr:histidine kinase [Cellulomonas flavigena]ADG73731.1 integral membrane sensor signal transduction histidine kinase [Cellulomonas flavigena DSM 20109]